MNVFILIETE